MKRMIMCAATLFICATAQAQEAKRSEMELFFLRPAEHLGKTFTFEGRLSGARPTGAYLDIKADRLGEKSITLRWKSISGEAWEEIQLQCGPKAQPICKRVSVTGTWAQDEDIPSHMYLKDAEYRFIK